MKHLPKSRRGGFTLIELLIVITIIVVLVSLLLGGIYYAYVTMKRTGTFTEIKQLDASLQAFKGKYGVYPPSRIRLCSNYVTYAQKPTPAANGGAQLDNDSIAFINRMWPNIGAFSGINWAGNGSAVDEILEGDQCLVFFLGGIPNPSGNSVLPFNDSLGFAKNNPKDPSAVSVTSPGQTYFAFSADRVYVRNVSSNPNTTFASYKDYHGQQPYLYFSAYNRKNGYAPPYAVPILGVQPYFSAANQFHNPDTCQIISAGGDGVFGAGGQWTTATAETVYPASNPGKDDQVNFYDAMMGVTR